MAATTNKKPSTKRVDDPKVWDGEGWVIRQGILVPGPGRPAKTSHLFGIIGEKLPFECLPAVRKHIEGRHGKGIKGVYLAHDSMGFARYGGRGVIFDRLAAHKRNCYLQLMYFSFYQIANRAHEREIETVILRTAGPHMLLNERKLALGGEPGNVLDYEPGSEFYERRWTGKFDEEN